MKSINSNLPKSSYGKDAETKKTRERNDSLDSLDVLKRDRALSACGVRNEANRGNQVNYVDLSSAGQARDNYSNKIIPQQPIQQKPVGMNLPPRPQRKTEKT